MEIVTKNQIEEIVINYHITSKCNYTCKYCFAEWKQPNRIKELYKDKAQLHKIAQDIKTSLYDKNIRINFAGGEPLLINSLPKIIKIFKSYGFKIGIITNGSRLQNIITEIIDDVDVLGISIDSNLENTNLTIGRSENGRPQDTERIINLCYKAKDLNPNCAIKINTVVSKDNLLTDLNTTISEINPDKWKIMQVVPFENKYQKVSINHFQHFIARHKQHSSIIQAETSEQIKNSYLMLDPYGRFFYNNSNTYKYSLPVIETGFINSLCMIDFDLEKYTHRYNNAKIS